MSDSLEPKRRRRLEARKPVEREEDFDKTLVACIPNLKRVAKQLTRDSYVADELLQITLIKAMQDRDTFRDNLNDPEMMNEMQRWTATILRNTYASLGRHASKNLEDKMPLKCLGIPWSWEMLWTNAEWHKNSWRLLRGCRGVRDRQWNSLLLEKQRRRWRPKWVLEKEQSSDIDSEGVKK